MRTASGDVADRAGGAVAEEGRRGGSGRHAASTDAAPRTSQRRMTAGPAGPLLPFQPGRPIGNIFYGACSWTDRTLIDAGTFYPPSVRTAADRLAHYASGFPIVEVDATYYALPSERNAHTFGWIARRPASCSTSKPSACSRTIRSWSIGSRLRSRSCCRPP